MDFQPKNIQEILTLLDLGRYDKALELIKEELSTNPESDYLHYLLSSVYLNLNDSKKALWEINEAITIDPEVSTYYSFKWIIFLNRWTYIFAEKASKTALELDPYNIQAFVVLAEAYFYQTNYKKSYKVVYEWLDLDPQNEALNDILLKLLALKWDTSEALEKAMENLEENPENTYTKSILGKIYLDKWKYKEAKELFFDILRDNPSDESAKTNLLYAIKNEFFIYRILYKFMSYKWNLDSKLGLILSILFIFLLIIILPEILVLILILIIFSFLALEHIFNIFLYFNRYGKAIITKIELIFSSFFVILSLFILYSFWLLNSISWFLWLSILFYIPVILIRNWYSARLFISAIAWAILLGSFISKNDILVSESGKSYKTAIFYIKENDFNNAFLELNNSISLDQDFSDSYLLRSFIYIHKWEYFIAKDDLDKYASTYKLLLNHKILYVFVLNELWEYEKSLEILNSLKSNYKEVFSIDLLLFYTNNLKNNMLWASAEKIISDYNTRYQELSSAKKLVIRWKDEWIYKFLDNNKIFYKSWSLINKQFEFLENSFGELYLD